MAQPLVPSRAAALAATLRCHKFVPANTTHVAAATIISNMPGTDVAQLQGAAAQAVVAIAEKTHSLTFKPLTDNLGVEICNDNPTVRTLSQPLVTSFTSHFWPVC